MQNGCSCKETYCPCQYLCSTYVMYSHNHNFYRHLLKVFVQVSETIHFMEGAAAAAQPLRTCQSAGACLLWAGIMLHVQAAPLPTDASAGNLSMMCYCDFWLPPPMRSIVQLHASAPQHAQRMFDTMLTETGKGT